MAESSNPEYVPLDQAVALFWSEIAAMKPEAICARTGAGRLSDTVLSVPCLSDVWRADLASQTVTPAPDTPQRACDRIIPFLIVTYLARCGPARPSGEMIAPRDMIPGNNFFQGEHTLHTHALAARFGADAPGFLRVCHAVGGVPTAHGDASARFRILPKVHAEVILHLADDEFPADVRVLIDTNMRHIFPADATYGALALLVNRLLGEGEEEESKD